MSEEGLLVKVVRVLQFGRNWVMDVLWRCHGFVLGASADSQGPVENRPQCITGDGASPSEEISSVEEWEEIATALTAKSSAPRLEISNNIDPAGEYKVPLAYADEASQPTHAAAPGASAQCQTPTPRRSLEDSKEQGNIIIAQRTPELAVKDVKIGKEVWVVNPCYVKITDQIESWNQEHEYIGVHALSEDRFRKTSSLQKPMLDNKGPGHVPLFVSEGCVSTFSMFVDQTKTTLVPSLESRRTAWGEGAEVLANLEQTPPTQGFSDSLGQGSSSSSFM